MKIVIAPDKFKGTLTALQVAKIEAAAFRADKGIAQNAASGEPIFACRGAAAPA